MERVGIQGGRAARNFEFSKFGHFLQPEAGISATVGYSIVEDKILE